MVVTINCTPLTYPLGGSVTGLIAGQLTLVNLDNSDVIAAGNGNFTFPTPVAFAQPYAVQLTAPAGQACAFTANTGNGAGIVPVGGTSSLSITCTPISFTLSGVVTGLVAGTQLTLHHGSEAISVNNGVFTFANKVAYTAPYSVTLDQPASQNCVFTDSNNTGTMPAIAR